MRAVIAILGIVILDMWAIMHGIDGALFLSAMGIISGLGGYPILRRVKNERVQRWLDGIK